MIEINVNNYDDCIELELCDGNKILSTMNIRDDEILKVVESMLKHLRREEKE